MAALGGELRRSRLRRRMKQAELAALIGVVQSTISVMERGHGGSLSVDLWQRAFTTLDRHLRLEPSRNARDDVADAGHLQIQNLVLRLGRGVGYTGSFELATRPSDPARSPRGCSPGGGAERSVLGEHPQRGLDAIFQ